MCWRKQVKRIEFLKSPSPQEICDLSDCSQETLVTIWTRQQAGAIEQLNTRRILRAEEKHIFPQGCSVGKRRAYDWMRDQMRTHIREYDGAWPIWASLTPPDSEKEDLAPGDKVIRARVPKKRLLISFYDYWEHILHCMALIENHGSWPSCWPVSPYIDIDTAGKHRLDGANHCITSIPEEECRESWEKIFELSLACTEGFSGGTTLQATLSTIYRQDVVYCADGQEKL